MSDRTYNFSKEDAKLMKLALKLAAKALGGTSPNPVVGAVLVKKGRIIGKGFHRKAGLAHAEVEALKGLSDAQIKGATLYVTLEPCCHEKKRTPPCTKFLIDKGVRRLVVAVRDPNKRVNGEGLRQLRRAGVLVQEGLLQKEAALLNEAYFYSITRALPFLTLKMAVSIDGKVATSTGDSKWISNESSRRFTHRLRSQNAALITSSVTVLKDNPHLGSRIAGVRDPLRIIVDRSLKTNLKAKVYRDNNVIVATTTLAPQKKIENFRKRGIELLVYPSVFSLKLLLKDLYNYGINSILMEAGGTFATAFLREKMVNKCLFFVAPKLVGANGIAVVGNLGVSKLSQSIILKNVTHQLLDEDVLISGYL